MLVITQSAACHKVIYIIKEINYYLKLIHNTQGVTPNYKTSCLLFNINQYFNLNRVKC